MKTPDKRWKYIVRTVELRQVEKCLNVEGQNSWEAFAVHTNEGFATVCFKQEDLNWPIPAATTETV